MVTKLERIAKMEAELAALKKDVEAEGQWVSPVFYPKKGDEYEHLSHRRVEVNSFGYSLHNPVFRPGTGQAFADAFQVMLELRACEGQCQMDGTKLIYTVEVNNMDGACTQTFLQTPSCAALSGAFATREHAQAAIEKVGESRILAAAKTLTNWRE